MSEYKNVPHIGLIPKDWSYGRVNDLVQSLDSGVSVNGQDRLKRTNEQAVLKVSAVSYGTFDTSAHKVISGNELERAKCSPKANRIIVSRSNTPELVGASAYIEKDHPYLFLPDKLWQIEPSENLSFSMRWLSFFLASDPVRYKLSSLATGTSDSMRNITKGELLSIPVPIPPEREQIAIAKCLEGMNTLLIQTQSLFNAKVELKRGLMQRLLTGKQRLSGYSTPWENVHLGDVTTELSNRNKSVYGFDSVMAVFKGQGLIPMREQLKRADLDRYKIVPPRAFAYNPMRINVGSLALSSYENDVLVSPDYIVFACSKGLLLPSFLDHFRHTKYWQHFVNIQGSGSVRVRIYYKDLAAMHLTLPDIPEQEAIVKILDLAQQEIDQLNHKLSLLKEQKRGLMQKLLTGEWRLPVSEQFLSQSAEQAVTVSED